MTPQQFNQWLADMRSAGLIRSQADAARMLGVTAEMIGRYKMGTTPITITIALACQALLNKLEPYPQ